MDGGMGGGMGGGMIMGSCMGGCGMDGGMGCGMAHAIGKGPAARGGPPSFLDYDMYGVSCSGSGGYCEDGKGSCIAGFESYGTDVGYYEGDAAEGDAAAGYCEGGKGCCMAGVGGGFGGDDAAAGYFDGMAGFGGDGAAAGSGAAAEYCDGSRGCCKAGLGGGDAAAGNCEGGKGGCMAGFGGDGVAASDGAVASGGVNFGAAVTPVRAPKFELAAKLATGSAQRVTPPVRRRLPFTFDSPGDGASSEAAAVASGKEPVAAVEARVAAVEAPVAAVEAPVAAVAENAVSAGAGYGAEDLAAWGAMLDDAPTIPAQTFELKEAGLAPLTAVELHMPDSIDASESDDGSLDGCPLSEGEDNGEDNDSVLGVMLAMSRDQTLASGVATCLFVCVFVCLAPGLALARRRRDLSD